jgi:putative ABC transport system ATP-binding protein
VTTATPAIDVEDVRYAWIPGQCVLDVPRFTVARGERVFLRGPSGSGKSTLLGVIAGVLRPQAGAVRLLGHDLVAASNAARDHLRAAHVGFIFQMFNLIPYLPVVDNVTLPLRFSPERRARAGADPAAEALRLLAELGLTEPRLLARPVTQLSIGQQQRVAAARALLGQPEVVIADEPTSSLDSDAREAFLTLLMRECSQAGAALVFVSHDTSLGHLFDRQVALADINRAGAATEAA